MQANPKDKLHIVLDIAPFPSIGCVVTKGIAMKMRKYEDIKPSNRTNFVMVYYHAGRTLTQIETLLKKAYGNPLPVRPRDRLNRLQFKLEQMTARYKQCEDETKEEYQKRKSQ